MATVTGYTAARMKQIEDETVVSGLVDVNGDLILYTREGSEFNAGHVKGEKGADGETPSPVIPYRLASESSASYPTGTSIINIPETGISDGWPASVATLLTVRHSTNRTWQQVGAMSSGRTWIRTYTGSAWGVWKEVSVEGHTHITDEVVGGNYYMFRQMLTFTSSGTFNKSSYPWLRAMRVRVQGGGGGGGGATAAGSTQHSVGSGGGGGGYAEAFVTANDLPNTLSVTVGAAGQGVLNNTGTFGGYSGVSRFSTVIARAGGGDPGARRGLSGITSVYPIAGGSGGVGTVGDLLVGGAGGMAGAGSVSIGFGGSGGSSVLGGGGGGSGAGAGGGVYQGHDASGYGGGGGGGATNQSSSSHARGGDGSPGIVILELYG